MKRVTKAFGVLAFTALLGISNPVVAQTTTDNTTTTTTTDDDNDGFDDWGLLGLIGLLGLLGRKKRDDVHVHRTTTTDRNH